MQAIEFKQIEPKIIDFDQIIYEEMTFRLEKNEQIQKIQKKPPEKSQSLPTNADKYGVIVQQKRPSLQQHQIIKQINARVEKWREMLPNLGRMVQQNDNTLKKRARKGIPDGLRTLIWPILAGVESQKGLSPFTVSKTNSFSEQIDKDVRRTFPNNVNFQDENICLQSLKDVLNMLSQSLPEMGYCQGLNFIAASLLMVMGDENVFLVMRAFMLKYHQLSKYIDPFQVRRQFFVFEKLLEQYYPSFKLNIDSLQIDTIFYATDWFITMFASILPLQLLYRVYDIFLVEGEKTLYRCALTILYYKQRAKEYKFLQGFEETVLYLKNHDDTLNYDIDQFIKIMTEGFTFSRRKIKEYYAIYDRQQKK